MGYVWNTGACHGAAVECGINLNFGISLGIVAGLLGSPTAIEMGIPNPWTGLFAAMAIGV